MKAKQQIINMLKESRDGFNYLLEDLTIGSNSWITVTNEINRINNLIIAVENAIFDLPTEEIIEQVYNVHTANECRDMDIDKFKSAVKELLLYL